ncbi:MAG: hypothetical protein RR334_00930 [Clostridia bacterium]
MKSKANKLKIQEQKLREIDELDLCIFIVEKGYADNIMKRIKEQGAIVLICLQANGVSRSAVAEFFSSDNCDYELIVVQAKAESSVNIIESIATEFNFNAKGNGKAFLINIDGYMGNKALFL